MFNDAKKQDVSIVKQREDKYSRYDYGKVRVDFSTGFVGESDKIKDSR
ncbi:hypothetical protein Q428_09815 [Fervidicella metallireducens AeB]|uniref:Uncharacterized protein n=1 Tax=Fervidicella metallireducens AeB TaxID=1403537 RepID=A0A017RW27_9CLOT|nr:hypothetical protein [Fervidicella metallireducens]EYE88105.1 hypothetical protein Q428_09815 [Fervidicella metallireducens AeB]